MNKICTDLSQSNKLIELGIDVNTADMWWNYYTITVGDTTPLIIHIAEPWVGSFNWENKPDNIPCWSLGALMDLLPKDEDTVIGLCFGGYKGEEYIDEWFCCFEGDKKPFEFHSCSNKDKLDAVFEMIVWLKENGKI